MTFIIKLHPEITTKSDSVRKRFIKILSSNIRNTLSKKELDVAVMRNWDFIEVRLRKPEQLSLVEQALKKISGIQTILEVSQYSFTTVDDIFKIVLEHYQDKLVNKSFVVRCKRKGTHQFNSLDVERYVGGGLKQHIAGSSVSLKHPQVTVKLEIIEQQLKLIINSYQGLGGFPLGTQGDVLSMISGGFDSAVSSYELIRRGCRVHYLFFNLGGRLHLQGVKHIVNQLWSNYSRSHKTLFIEIPFQEIVNAILEKVDSGMTGVILKRLFYYVADRVAQQFNMDAIVTGEAIGQVSSQTLHNLNQIDKASQTMVIRPLVAMDKEQIISQARKIGTAEISQTIPEFCGVISNKPTVKALPQQIVEQEANLDLEELISNAIANATITATPKLFVDSDDLFNLEIVVEPLAQDVIIDIRDSQAVEQNPLTLDNKILEIPFYKLQDKFASLDPKLRYLLYCERGVLSKIHVNLLQHQNFSNLAVLSPKFKA